MDGGLGVNSVSFSVCLCVFSISGLLTGEEWVAWVGYGVADVLDVARRSANTSRAPVIAREIHFLSSE